MRSRAARLCSKPWGRLSQGAGGASAILPGPAFGRGLLLLATLSPLSETEQTVSISSRFKTFKPLSKKYDSFRSSVEWLNQ